MAGFGVFWRVLARHFLRDMSKIPFYGYFASTVRVPLPEPDHSKKTCKFLSKIAKLYHFFVTFVFTGVKFCRFPELPYNTHNRVVFRQKFTEFYRILPLPQNFIIYPVVDSPERSK